jgi:saccharopine dehydrogenase-like NADP-dependent oxidoreductase
MKTILILGGSGFFGERIAAALASDSSLTVLVAGRDSARAAAAAHAIGLPLEQALSVATGDAKLSQTFRALRVDLVIHAAGPFQGQDYAVARAAIEAGCHYLDLADGRQFVMGIDTLAASARARGVTVISGASSLPALSSAVVDRYLAKFQFLDSIEIGISSGARAPGLATVRGVFSYGGKPFRVWKDGVWVERYGWLDIHRHKFPQPLGRRWLGSCDIPDLELFPRRYPAVKTVSFQAGFASDLGHLVVWSLAALVKAGALPGMEAFAAPLNRISRWMEPLVSDTGGMFVTLKGGGPDRRRLSISWNLIARRNHGPYIPCAAAIALAAKIAGGVPLPAGAMPCVGLLTVEELLEPLRALDIHETVTQ